MMLTADDGYDLWSGGDFQSGGGDLSTIDDEFNLSIDLDSFYSILGEDTDPQKLSPGDSSYQNYLHGDSEPFFGSQDSFLLSKGQLGSEGTPPLGTYLPGGDYYFLSNNLEDSDLKEWGSENIFNPVENFGHKNLELFDLNAGNANHVSDCLENAELSHARGHCDFKYMLQNPVVLEINGENYGIPIESSMETLKPSVDSSSASILISSNNVKHVDANTCHLSNNICSDSHPAMQYSMTMDDIPFPDLYDNRSLEFLPSYVALMNDEREVSTRDKFGISNRHVPHLSGIDSDSLNGFKYEDNNYKSRFSENNFLKGSIVPSSQTQSYPSSENQASFLKEERSNESVTPQSSTEVMVKDVNSKFFPADDDSFFTGQDLKKFFPNQPQISITKQTARIKDEKVGLSFAVKTPFHSIGETVNRNSTHGGLMAVQNSNSLKKQLVHIKNEKEGNVIPPRNPPPFSKLSSESIQNTPLGNASDDDDICILEDISMPPCPKNFAVQRKALVTSKRSPYYGHVGDSTQRLKPNDEREIFRVALQDLSQPKLEASPPEGLLAVSLLRHQKIALAWMVQKETANLYCSGGILADDQGLGKTISTIALILKERSPSSKAFQKCMNQGELETLNLEDDDDLEHDIIKSRDTSVKLKGRLAAGTLVVCPTSVLRQWAEELKTKVTQEANLSVLIYHGSSRTKDPSELAKYDVVLTTYAIVGMEVPKQPLVDRDDGEKTKEESVGVVLASSKKRKYPPNSYQRELKEKKVALNERDARPLAKVAWFRVVLDEAQSIKNHKTQVARACWGLRAKRRWCLSGTPIQNAIDDLYSYFRFLRYDPYAVYQSFLSTIKLPITKNPANGYRKLQAVLKTIMLRRTKGTLLDGKPIINLPPKSVELKKVDFSDEERDFYSRLEADSRAQFEEYAAAGTVKQNYVNILLMLLRLRQACDHPILVNVRNSSSTWRSSVDMAKKLPQDKISNLLTCLEASLAICGICSDPPEDAVVSICSHVFCNQCICEHLTGDDKQCPCANCKAQLSVSSVFSKPTLKSLLDTQSTQSSSPSSSICEAVEPCSQGLSFVSSKIKAALEVLQSLSKPRYVRSLNETTTCPEVSSDLQTHVVHKDIPDKDMGMDLDGSVKVMGEKAIVFSQWTRMLDLVEAGLKTSSIQYRRLDGTMSVLARDKAVKEFNTLPEVSVMIMSLKAASLGLNMVAACHVILLDLWWNPTTEDQAIDRAHRIGQTRPVKVLRLTVKDTVEDRILALQQTKRHMVASAFGEDETGSCQTRLTVDDLKYLFRV